MKKENMIPILGVGSVIIYDQIKKFQFKKDRLNKEGNYNVFLNICKELGVDFNSGEQLSGDVIEKICKVYKQRTNRDLLKDLKYTFK